MCGRFNIISDPLTQLIMSIVNGELGPINIETRYNVAPTESVPVLLRTENGDWDMRDMRWWLLPFWSSDPAPKYTMFNAKSETLHKSRAFKEPFKRRRCIVPASGYYEWTKRGGIKIPYLIRPEDESGFAFAGLWDRWRGGDQVIESCTIITGDAPANMQDIHKRVPIHLNQAEIEQWLGKNTSQQMLTKILSPALRMPLSVTPVSNYVGNPRNKDPRCIESLGEFRIIH